MEDKKNPAISSEEEESVVAMERIYIGGFVEDRLSAKDVVDRLQTNPPDGTRFISFDIFQTFLFATLCKTTPTSSTTAVQIVASHYNNVRWKGCKIKVEPAKPHILQLLAQEREQQQQLQQQQQLVSTATVTTPTTSILTRHLRIRRRRGEEITKVDTKPKTFRISIHQITATAAKHGVKTSSSKNRALHILFQEADEECSPLNSNNNTNTNNSVSEDDSSICSTDNSTNSSSNETSDTVLSTNLTTSTKSKYQWSDDDDDEEEDEDDDVTTSASSSNTDHQEIELEADLSRDVSNNMDIFSQLFPDRKQERNHVSENSSALLLQQQKQQHQHQRYDPTSASAKQFEIIIPSDDTNTSTHNFLQENPKVLLHKSPEIIQTTDVDSSTNVTTTIYQEKKLETIFQCSTLKKKQTLNDTSTTNIGFGFEFPLEDNNNIMKDEEEDAKDIPMISTATSTIVEVDDSEDNNNIAAVVPLDDSKKRRLGFVFPQELLDQWEDEFFAMDYTITDEEWEERRKTLTLDWKRKYKLVKTQEQKQAKKRKSK